LPTTAETLAKQHGVSPATIKRDGKFTEAAKKLPAAVQSIVANKPDAL
jgi:DeoR/GlpR family transcriptional regulator of sugar metabolism